MLLETTGELVYKAWEMLGLLLPFFIFVAIFQMTFTIFVGSKLIGSPGSARLDESFIERLIPTNNAITGAGMTLAIIGTVYGILLAFTHLAEGWLTNSNLAVAYTMQGVSIALASTLAGLIVARLWGNDINDNLLDFLFIKYGYNRKDIEPRSNNIHDEGSYELVKSIQRNNELLSRNNELKEEDIALQKKNHALHVENNQYVKKILTEIGELITSHKENHEVKCSLNAKVRELANDINKNETPQLYLNTVKQLEENLLKFLESRLMPSHNHQKHQSPQHQKNGKPKGDSREADHVRLNV